MIIIQNFDHAYRLYQQGKIPFRLLQEQAMVLIGICPQPGRYIDEAFDIGDDDIEWLLQQPEIAEEDYNGMLGGEVYVCESEDDLKQVVGMDLDFAKSHGNRWPDVTDQVMSWDACNYLSEKPEGATDVAPDGATDVAPAETAEWAMFLLCWNDAGGPVFYVPKHLWQAARVAEHIAETSRHWG